MKTRSIIEDAKERNAQIRIKMAKERYQIRKLTKRSAIKIQQVFRSFYTRKTKQRPSVMAVFSSIYMSKG